ncbi:MAG: VOC family protein [Acidimicrobiia bacterium]
MNPHLRIARPTDRLDEIAAMYREGLGLEDLGGFEGHDGFDGAMLGSPGGSWHLEFTHHRGRAVTPSPTEEDLLVFYIPDEGEWTAARRQMVAAGFEKVTAYSPYWDQHG